MRQALEKLKPPKRSISKAERLAISSLQDDDSIKILPVDKGDATVVMDSVEYPNWLADLIGHCRYCKVKRYLAQKTERKLLQILGKKKDLTPQIE